MKRLLVFVSLLMFTLSGVTYAQGTVRHDDPKLKVGEIFLTYKKDELTANTTVRTLLRDPRLIFVPTTWEVESFTFSMFPTGQDFIGPFNVKGARLTSEIVNILTAMDKPQGRIIFNNIKIRTEDKTERSFASVILHVK